MSTSRQKVTIVITGCSSGFGRVTALHLEKLGLDSLSKIDLAVAAIDFQHRSSEKDDVVANLLDDRRVLDRQSVDELHQHLGAAGFRRMHRPRRVVHRLSLGHQSRRFIAGDLARIR